jgi:O-antigen ligase
MENNTSSLIQKAYLFFFGTMPLIYSESFADPVLMPRQLFLSLFLLFIWCVLLAKGFYKKLSFEINKLSLLLAGCSVILISLSFGSAFYSHVTSESLYVSSKYSLIFVFLLTTWFLLRNNLLARKHLIFGGLAFCISAVTSGCIDLILLLKNNISILDNPNSISSTFANKNLFASVLLLSIWPVLNLEKRVIKFFLLLIITLFIILIQSKIVLASFFFMLIAFAFKRFSNKKFSLVAGIILVVIAIILFRFSGLNNLSSLHTFDTRIACWINSVEMIKEKPFGVGAGNWQIFFPKYGLAHFDLEEIQSGRTLFRQPHNDFIWMFCELGVLGGLIYVAFFVLLFIIIIRIARKDQSVLSFSLLITVIAYCFVAFFDFPLERIEHQVLFSVIIALVMNEYDSCHKERRYRFATSVFPSLLVIIFSLIVSFYRLKGEYFSREIFSLSREKSPAVIEEKYLLARSIFYTIDPRTVPVEYYEAVALYHQDKLKAAIEHLQSALRTCPYNLIVLKELENLYTKTGNKIKSKEYREEILRISPNILLMND